MNLAHITMSTVERRALARDESERRTLVRALVRTSGPQLALFNLVDEHLHLLARGERPARIAESVRRVLSAKRRDLKLTRPHVKLVRDQDHLRNLVPYILTQTDHHQIAGANPAVWTGSCLLDLIGARLIDAAWLERLPADLAALLKAILHDPMGSGSRVRSQSCAPPGQPFIRWPCPITASFAHPLGGWGFILLGRRIP